MLVKPNRLRSISGGDYLAVQVANILRTYGTDAHVYLPGIGIINGLTAGNYLDSAGTTGATVDNPVGLVLDAGGAIDATQATTANKPILRRGAVNLLTYSEQFDNVIWAKVLINAFGSGSTVNATTAPDGTVTADKITPSGTTAPSVFQSYAGAVSGLAFTASVYVKAAGAGFATLQINGIGGTTVASFVSIDLSNGTLGTIQVLAGGGLTSASATSTAAANGFYRVTLKGTLHATNTSITTYIGITDAQNTRTATISTTNGIFVWGAQLELGSTASTYIPTTTAPASSATGNYAWQFDGTNDKFDLGAPLWQMADDSCLIAGFNYSAINTIASIASPAANPESFSKITALTSGSANSISAKWTSNTPSDFKITSAIVAGTPYVASARKVSNTGGLRVNSVSKGTVDLTGVASTVTTGYIGFEGGTNALAVMNGSIYPVIAIKGTVTDADLLILEKFVGSLSGVQI